jgi:hypothetical protein
MICKNFFLRDTEKIFRLHQLIHANRYRRLLDQIATIRPIACPNQGFKMQLLDLFLEMRDRSFLTMNVKTPDEAKKYQRRLSGNKYFIEERPANPANPAKQQQQQIEQ